MHWSAQILSAHVISLNPCLLESDMALRLQLIRRLCFWRLQKSMHCLLHIGVINVFWFDVSTNGVGGPNCTRLLFLSVWKVNSCVRTSAKANTFGLLKNNEDLSDYRNKHLNTARFLFLLLLMLHWRYCHAAALFFFLFLLFLCLSIHIHSSCIFPQKSW